MSATFVVAALGLVLHDFDFLAAADNHDGPLDLRTFDKRCADGRVRAVVDQENLVERDGVTLLEVAGELLDRDSVALGDDILLPAGLNYGHFHGLNTSISP